MLAGFSIEAIRSMWPAVQFFKQTTVLIADQHGFASSYLAHSRNAVGCNVVGPFSERRSLDDMLSADDAAFTGAILAIDWLDRGYRDLQWRLTHLGVPCLLIDNALWRHLAAMHTSFAWLYASFQVLEALQRAIVTAASPTSDR